METLTEKKLYPNYLINIIDKLSKDTCKQINNKFKHFLSHFKNLPDDQKLLLTQKSVYPYDYMDSFKEFTENKFPSIESCHSKLSKEDLPEEDYQRALTV